MSEKDDEKPESLGGLAEAYLGLSRNGAFKDVIKDAEGFRRAVAEAFGKRFNPLAGPEAAAKFRAATSIPYVETIELASDSTPARTAEATERAADHLQLLLGVMYENVAHAEATRALAERTAREAELTRIGNERSAKFSRIVAISSVALALVSTIAAITAIFK